MRKQIVLVAEDALTETLYGSPVQGAHQLRRAKNTGVRFTVQLSIVNGTELGTQEWRDSIFLIYGLEPIDIPHYCDGCNATFSIIHYLDFKWGGLVTLRHNKLRDRVVDMS